MTSSAPGGIDAAADSAAVGIAGAADENAAGARLHFLFLNLGHFLDHLFMLIFSSVAALVLVHEWGLSYSELIPYATPGFIAFAAFTLPAGWLADRYGRENLITVFFVGIGLASVATSLAASPVQIASGLFVIGIFASIYHPVGIALVLEGRSKTGMRVASNGVWGNLGVATAALLTGALIDFAGWRVAFVIPGVISVLLGVIYAARVRRYSPGLLAQKLPSAQPDVALKQGISAAADVTGNQSGHSVFARVLLVVLLTTACGGIVFQSTTFALPKVLLEKSGDLAASATVLGWLAFAIFAIGSMGQLVVGYLLDRGSPRPVFMAVALLQVIFFSLTIKATGVWVLVFAAGFMLAAFGQIPINDVLVGRVVGRAYRSRVLAIRYTITLSTMALSVPLIAMIHARGGVSSLFVVLAVVAAVITVCTFALPKGLAENS